jgi:hypothetical protein
MQKKLFIVLALLLLTNLSFLCKALSQNKANKKVVYENWQATSITIDGEDRDWDLQQFITDEKNHIIYNITNDSSNLYVFMKTDNNPIKMRILEAGMYLYINNRGREKETAALIFPLSNKNSYKPIFRIIQKIDSASSKKYLNGLTQFSLFGLASSEEGGRFFSNEYNELGIQVKIGFDKDFNLIYEAAIPLGLLTTTDATGLPKRSKVVAIGFGINTFPKPASVYDLGITSNQFDDGMPPMPPINKDSKMSDEDLLFREIKIWKTVKIALKRNLE